MDFSSFSIKGYRLHKCLNLPNKIKGDVTFVSQRLNLLRLMKGGVTLGHIVKTQTWCYQRRKFRDKLQMGVLHCNAEKSCCNHCRKLNSPQALSVMATAERGRC